MEKARKKEIKKQLKKQNDKKKKKKKNNHTNEENKNHDAPYLPVTNDAVILEMTKVEKHGSGDESIIVKKIRQKHRRALSTEEMQSEMDRGAFNLQSSGRSRDSLSSSSNRHDSRQTTIDRETKKKVKKRGWYDCRGSPMAVVVQRIYWICVVFGAIYCGLIYRFQKEVGEVGCIAREGNPAYLALAICASIAGIGTYILLSGIRDEHHIRMEISFVGVIAACFVLPHGAMANYVLESMTFGRGCTESFFEFRSGAVVLEATPELHACLIQLYSNWLLLIMILFIHTASIAFPVLMTLQMGADKLREQHVIHHSSFDGPQLLSSFELAIQDSECALSFRRFLANEFTLDNMRFLVEIENFNIQLFPTALGVLGDVLGTGHGVETVGDSDAPSFARPCHTVDAWQTFSGNLPISLISPSGRKKIKTGIDHIDIGERNIFVFARVFDASLIQTIDNTTSNIIPVFFFAFCFLLFVFFFLFFVFPLK
jgi:hypothetical protein